MPAAKNNAMMQAIRQMDLSVVLLTVWSSHFSYLRRPGSSELLPTGKCFSACLVAPAQGASVGSPPVLTYVLYEVAVESLRNEIGEIGEPRKIEEFAGCNERHGATPGWIRLPPCFMPNPNDKHVFRSLSVPHVGSIAVGRPGSVRARAAGCRAATA